MPPLRGGMDSRMTKGGLASNLELASPSKWQVNHGLGAEVALLSTMCVYSYPAKL
jgi:hypothetical protein